MRIIDKLKENIKAFIHSKWIDEAFWITLVIFATMGAFSLGMRHQREISLVENPIRIEQDSRVVEAWQEYISTKKSAAKFFASKNGTVYYPLACSSGDRIAEKNRVYFNNEVEARGAGFKQSKRCN
ncbi:MAG: hypothetical protein LR005_02120 [Candidatus Pacebacteria bacterium]|nr:hypothetical protein [Candidatus Paceibacterota bacterium]